MGFVLGWCLSCRHESDKCVCLETDLPGARHVWLVELERCAKIAKEMRLGPAEEADDDLVRGYTNGFNAACREIAAAIRKEP